MVVLLYCVINADCRKLALMMNVIMLNVILMNAIMPSVMAPYETYLSGAPCRYAHQLTFIWLG